MAALLDGKPRGLEVGAIAKNACTTDAYMAPQSGATPRWDAALRERVQGDRESWR